MKVFSVLPVVLLLGSAHSGPSVVDKRHNLTYNGFDRNGVEVFLNIPYGQDTSGENRFKPPQLHHPEPGSIINAQSLGPACPQQTGRVFAPLALANTTNISEDCLNLNIVRPKGSSNFGSRLPVMLFIHGGSFWVGSNGEPTTSPDGLILESIQNELPVIHIAINYRLGCRWDFNLLNDFRTNWRFSQSLDLRNQNLWSKKSPLTLGSETKD